MTRAQTPPMPDWIDHRLQGLASTLVSRGQPIRETASVIASIAWRLGYLVALGTRPGALPATQNESFPACPDDAVPPLRTSPAGGEEPVGAPVAAAAPSLRAATEDGRP